MTALNLERRRLAPGLTTHPLGVGSRRIGSEPAVSDAEWTAALHTAVERGADLFDTADTYGEGRAERLIGQVLRCYPHADLKVSSKVGHQGSAPHPYAAPHLRHQLEQSIENLGVERMDLYVLPSFDFGDNDRYLRPAIDQMHTLREVGMIGAIGLRGPDPCTRGTDGAAQPGRFLQLLRLVEPDVVLTRFNALTPTVLLDGQDLFTFTAQNSIGLLLAAPFAGGVLAWGGDRGPATALSPQAWSVVSAGLDRLRAQLVGGPAAVVGAALQYCLGQAPHSAVVAGFSSRRQVAENFDSLAVPLSAGDLGLVGEVYRSVRDELAVLSAAGSLALA
ncbi:aldo/keto reductase [Kitasatospora sp. NPDC088783]|uniref:aldo/keto reductase n=1 Tax=Kitasatospora sp. NPDC088783 TaxID=3364077 RepID=UPI0037F4DB4B